jgi:hypothetical protein
LRDHHHDGDELWANVADVYRIRWLLVVIPRQEEALMSDMTRRQFIALVVGAHTEAQVLANVSSMQATIPRSFGPS